MNNVFSLVKAGKIQDANTLAFGDMQTAANDLQAILDKMLDNSVKDAQVTSQNNKGIVSSAIVLMICIVVGAVVVAIILGIVISRVISKPLNAVSADAERLALGDTDITVDEVTGRNDEISRLKKCDCKGVSPDGVHRWRRQNASLKAT